MNKLDDDDINNPGCGKDICHGCDIPEEECPLCLRENKNIEEVKQLNALSRTKRLNEKRMPVTDEVKRIVEEQFKNSNDVKTAKLIIVKPCPFCKAKAVIDNKDNDSRVPVYIINHEKGCYLSWLEIIKKGSSVTRLGGWNGQEEIDAWNKRTP